VNLAELLIEQVRARPNVPAIIESYGFRTRACTFAELDTRSRHAATLLHEAEIKPGDYVLIFQPMSVELYEALLAVFRLGAVAMFLDPGAGLAHLERCCALARPTVLIASWRAHLLRLRSGALRAIPKKLVIGPPTPGATRWSMSQHLPAHVEIFPAEDDTPALLTFTSGSTGEPKGAVRTHGLLLAQHRAIERGLTLQPGEVDLTTLPIFLLANLASGVTSVIPDADLRRPGTIDPQPVLKQIIEHRITRCTASPAFLERLLEGATAQPAALRAMQKIFTGGAPVFPRLVDELAAAMPHATIHPVYGSTEAEPIAHLERGEISTRDRDAMQSGRGLLAGEPVPEVELRILRERWGAKIGPFTRAEFESEFVTANEAGEIVVSGPHVLPGYLGSCGDDETKFRVNGVPWHRTGDAGWLDDSGRLWLLGRCGAKIADARGMLWPFAVECAAMQHADVRRAAVIAHENQRVLLLECRGHEEQVKAEVARQLAWAQLDLFRVVPRIPMDRRHNAKVDYPAVREMLRH
jgi:olefin beta-lactone synthetase